MEVNDRVKLLVEGAKYDVSCSSSGSANPSKPGALGNAAIGGICHSFTSDGRCVSLLKILLSNHCEFDCLYCVNRRSSDVPRARLTPAELAELTYNFYRRNYIEGLFLSSAVDTSPNHTMQLLTETVVLLRKEYLYNGYIHLKAIPGADRELVDFASRFVDRMSMNIELPSESSLKLLAPQKKKNNIVEPMKQLAVLYNNQKEDKSLVAYRADWGDKAHKAIPAGQTTQMIVGATDERDGQIIRLSEALYRNYGLKRVYYSAYTPVGKSSLLPSVPPNLKRENRLYQADWLLRFYGFNADEILPDNYNLDTEVDPKFDWALRNIDKFPVEINSAPYEMLLRVPGIGVKNAWRIANARRSGKLDLAALKRMRVVLKRAVHFVTVDGHYYGFGLVPDLLRESMTHEYNQSSQITMAEYKPDEGLFNSAHDAGNKGVARNKAAAFPAYDKMWNGIKEISDTPQEEDNFRSLIMGDF